MTTEELSPEFVDEIRAALAHPQGREQVRALEEVVRLAQRHQSFLEEFVARNELVDAMFHDVSSPDQLTHIAWLRSALAPERQLDAPERHDVLWKLKWGVDTISELPEVTLASWRAALDDMEVAYRAEGYSMRPVLQARAELAHSVGDTAQQRQFLGMALESWRDRGADCQACEARLMAIATVQWDRPLAFRYLQTVTGGDLSCGHEPGQCLSYETLWRAQDGDYDGAATSFRSAWAIIADDPVYVDAVARCLAALVMMGNTDRALALVVPRLLWLSQLKSPSEVATFATSAAWVLDNAVRLGLAPESLNDKPVAEYAASLKEQSAGVAARFDQRNGSSVFSIGLAAMVNDAVVRQEPTLPPTQIAAAAPSQTLEPITIETVIASAEQAIEDRRNGRGATIARRWNVSRDQVRAAASTPQQWWAIGYLDTHSSRVRSTPEDTAAQLDDAIAAYTTAGHEEGLASAHAAQSTARLQQVIAEHGENSPEADAARAAARERLAALDAGGWRESAADARRWFLLNSGTPSIEQELESVAQDYAAIGQPVRAAMAYLDLAWTVANDDLDRARSFLARAEQTAPEAPAIIGMSHLLRAYMARAHGDFSEAMAHFEQTISYLEEDQERTFGVLINMMEVLAEQEDWSGLERTAQQALAIATATKDQTKLAQVQRYLGLAYLETHRTVDAAELLDAALTVAQAQVQDLVAPVGVMLGNANRMLGSWAAARKAYASASLAYEAQDSLAMAAEAQFFAAASAREMEDYETAAAHLDDAIEKARTAQELPTLYVALRNRAGLTAALGDVDGAITALDDVLPNLANEQIKLPDDHPGLGFDLTSQRADVLRQVAHLLAGDGRIDEALERMEKATSLAADDDEALSLETQSAMMMADADRLEAAEPRLRSALEALQSTPHADLRIQGAAALARALDRAGRSDDAEAAWQQFGETSA